MDVLTFNRPKKFTLDACRVRRRGTCWKMKKKENSYCVAHLLWDQAMNRVCQQGYLQHTHWHTNAKAPAGLALQHTSSGFRLPTRALWAELRLILIIWPPSNNGTGAIAARATFCMTHLLFWPVAAAKRLSKQEESGRKRKKNYQHFDLNDYFEYSCRRGK